MSRVFRFAQPIFVYPAIAQRIFVQRVICVGGLWCLGISLLGVLTLSPALWGQASPDSAAGVPVVTDWSHHHLIFSRPETAEQSRRVQRDPRYWQQLFRRTPGTLSGVELDGTLASELRGSHFRPPRKTRRLKRDWQQDMNAGATVGAGQYPGEFSFNADAGSCTKDFVVFNTGLAGATTQASILAYTNIYVGCSGNVPTVYWAYNTGGTIGTSVTMSDDGSQIAFVQTSSSGNAQLALLKWSASGGSASAPTTPTSVSAANYQACTAPCMTTLDFTAGSGEGTPIKDTNSAPYYDFTLGSDTLYVGDDKGFVHQFTGVFAGTPAETSGGTGAWPAKAAVTQLSSPVFDSVTGNVFVAASYKTSGNGGRLVAVCATSACTGGTVTIGTVTRSGVLGPASGANCYGPGGSGTTSNLRLDTPIVDSTAGMVYAFVGNDGNGNSAVIQFATTVSSGQFSGQGGCGTEATIGTGSTTGVPLFAGSFDNLYFSSSGSSPTGNLYACGNTSGNATFYQLPITANVMAASGTSVLAISTANTTCSPVTEAYSDSNNTDLMFLSVQNFGDTSASVNCPANTGCLMSFPVPVTLGGQLPTSTKAALSASGGTSGVVIDNTVPPGSPPGSLQTSQIYFSTLSDQVCGTSGTGGCAVQASQAGLK